MNVRFVTVFALMSSSSAWAQQLPTAGTQLQQLPPAPTVQAPEPELVVPPRSVPRVDDTSGPKVRVTSLRVTGQTVFAESALVQAAALDLGRDASLSDLRAAAARISAYYNSRGYFLAQAYLPAQDIAAGAVTVAVIEGHYGAVTLRNDTHMASPVATRLLRGLDAGDIVYTPPLERRLLLLSDLPGVRVKSTLSPGTAAGTSDLLVALTPGRRIDGSVEADNAGNRYTGTYRIGGSLNFNDPLGIGDMLSLRLLGSSGGLGYGRIAYQAPIGALTLGAAYAHIRYDLGREFSSLDADGTADIASVYASYPLVRSRAANLYAIGGFDAKYFIDRVRLVSTRSHKHSQLVTAGFNGNTRDSFAGGGSTVFSASWSHGNLDLDSALDRTVDATTAHSAGGFDKANFSLARLQTVSGPLSFYGAVRGQIALDNLDSSEKMELGGAYGVRAYPEGEAYGDQGYIATAEARLTLDRWTRGLPGSFQAIGFIDVGEVEYAHTPWFAGSNHAHRSGIGGGLSWAAPEHILLSATYATKLGGAATTSGPDRPGRAWFQIAKLF